MLPIVSPSPPERNQFQVQAIDKTASVQPISAQSLDAAEKDLAEATYFSPIYRVDVKASTSIMQFRDSVTGEVTKQIPSEKQMQAYLQGSAEPEKVQAKEGTTEEVKSQEIPKHETAPPTPRSEEQVRSGVSIDV